MSLCKKIGSAGLILCALALGAGAQTKGNNSQNPSGQEPNGPIKVTVNLVNVLFTVTNKKSKLITDLTKDDVQVLEDNKPQTITNFGRESDLPLRIGILIDTSNSVRERLHFEEESAVDFLDSTVRPKKDLAFVVAFDVESQVIQDYTDDMEKLSEGIRSLRAGGGTALYDAIYAASKERMLVFPPPEPYLRRVMVVISDGLDNQSQHTREEALSMAQRGEVTIFAISTNRTGVSSRGDKILKYFADETGGKAFFPFEPRDLAVSFQEIARELRSQYSLAYVSSNAARDGTFRVIAVNARDKNLRVRAKTGYFAPSQ